MEKISIKTGTTVEGNDFYGREKELHYAWKYHISKGVSLLLSAPRRVGKSSFSKRMLKMAEGNGWKTLYLDLQGISTEQEFVKLLKDEIKSAKWWNKAGEIILTLFKSIELPVGKVNPDVWRNDTYSKIQQLIGSTGDILIVIDELAIFLDHLLKENGKEKVEFFLAWLRKFRQVSGTRVRWIFCSSVGIENFASMHQLSKHLNDIHPFSIGAFSEYEAKDFISRLDVDENIQFTTDDIQYMLDKLVWHLPFFIQIWVEKINSLICAESKQFSKDTIDEAYNRLITENQLYFNSWDERLKYYNEFEDSARKILLLCTLQSGRDRGYLLANLSEYDAEKIVAKLLAMLKNDGYLTEHDGKYIFRSPLLRDFWYNRFIK